MMGPLRCRLCSLTNLRDRARPHRTRTAHDRRRQRPRERVAAAPQPRLPAAVLRLGDLARRGLVPLRRDQRSDPGHDGTRDRRGARDPHAGARVLLRLALGGRAGRPARPAEADDRGATSRGSVVCVAFLLVRPRHDLAGVSRCSRSLSVFSAPFDPASSAAIPNLVAGRGPARPRTPWAARSGARCSRSAPPSAASSRRCSGATPRSSSTPCRSLISALLLSGIRRPFSEDRAVEEHPSILEATIETLQYAQKDHRVLSLIAVKAGFGLAAGVLALIPVFAKRGLRRRRHRVRDPDGRAGLGALVGPFFGHRFAGPGHRRIFPRDRRRARGVRARATWRSD